jgi:hypothetical protein
MATKEITKIPKLRGVPHVFGLRRSDCFHLSVSCLHPSGCSEPTTLSASVLDAFDLFLEHCQEGVFHAYSGIEQNTGEWFVCEFKWDVGTDLISATTPTGERLNIIVKRKTNH